MWLFGGGGLHSIRYFLLREHVQSAMLHLFVSLCWIWSTGTAVNWYVNVVRSSVTFVLATKSVRRLRSSSLSCTVNVLQGLCQQLLCLCLMLFVFIVQLKINLIQTVKSLISGYPLESIQSFKRSVICQWIFPSAMLCFGRCSDHITGVVSMYVLLHYQTGCRTKGRSTQACFSRVMIVKSLGVWKQFSSSRSFVSILYSCFFAHASWDQNQSTALVVNFRQSGGMQKLVWLLM